ncbi:hypothetical protein CMO91_00335 [Candidatus Woesearchaeota archaeon]|nr:hypothetical protein [Candidatus Woesearchaeota archaeon]|tara:strand:- start:320 stop:727 length:408 start_codon:yes stop_codon:yes gene_type:complete
MMHLHRYEDYAIIPLRLVLAAIFLFAGINKALSLSGTAEMFAGMGIPVPVVFAFIVMILEIVGGLCLLLGLFTRYASLWLTVIMIVAIALVGWKQLLVPVTRMNFFMLLAVLGGLITMILAGAKRPSLDEHFLLD